MVITMIILEFEKYSVLADGHEKVQSERKKKAMEQDW